jgi:hypothetical protein
MRDEYAGNTQASAEMKDRPASPATRESGSGRDTMHEARAQAGALWEDTKDKARAVLNEQQKSAADGIGDFAGALRTAAGELESRDKSMAAHLGEHAADGLERLAGTLRNKDASTIVRELESFARREPAVFLGAAVAVGFLAVRFLKSSEDRTGTRTDVAAAPQSHAQSHPSSQPGYAPTTQGDVHGYGTNPR